MTFHSIEGGGSYGEGSYGEGFYGGRNPRYADLCVEIDFTNDPSDSTRVWTDVTEDVRELSYVLDGRNDALQRTSTGSLQMTLNNRAGDYDPTNASGAYYPGVKRLRWIRVRSQWDGVEYPEWQGLIESWTQAWPEAGKDATVTVTAATALKALNLFDLGGRHYSAQRTDQRVSAVCADVGVAGTFDTGISSVVDSGTFTDGSSALSHLQDVEETENGRLFTTADALVTFQSRHYRLLNSSTSRGTIGDAAGEVPYRPASAALVSDDQNIWNRAIVTPSGGTAETATDDTSIATYFERTLTRSILTSDQSEARSAAQFLVGLYGDPAPKLPKLTLIPVAAPAQWPTVLGLVNSNRVTFKRRAVAAITQDGFVEQKATRILPGILWDVDVQLSAAPDQAGWNLGDAVYGLLGESTVLVY